MATQALTTGEELLQMPHDGRRFELIQGELIELTPAGGEHCAYNADLATEINLYVRQHNLGKVLTGEPGFYLSHDPDTIRAADIAFVTWEWWNQQTRKYAFLEGAPDLAIEVVSPHDRADEVTQKALQWLEAGSRLVWVVQPRSRTVTAYFPGGAARVYRAHEYLDGVDVLPGFTLLVSDIFR